MAAGPIVWAIFLLWIRSTAMGLDNGLGLSPAMGYNTWNDFRCGGISAANIMKVADAMVGYGLQKAGYEYLVIDDCWAAGRDNRTNRLVPDPQAFPNGLPAVVRYVHSKGLKFGIYTDRGTNTCAKRPGSQGFEELDAQTFADWGVDYLKEDSCYAPEDRQSSFEQYAKMRDSLNKTGRPIYFSLCGWKPWYAPVGTTLGNSWRISDDVNSWDDIYRATRVNMGLLPFAGPGGWNDPDMLLGSTPGAAATVTPVQSRTQFNLWVVMAAPLLIGSNLLHLSAFDRETYTNAEVLAVSQDPLGQPGFVVVDSCGEFNETGSPSPPECQQVWAKRLSRGAYAVLMVNWARHPVRVQCDSGCLQSVGLYGKVDVRDLWAQADLGPMEGITVDLKGGGPSAMFRLTSAQKEQNFSQ